MQRYKHLSLEKAYCISSKGSFFVNYTFFMKGSSKWVKLESDIFLNPVWIKNLI